MLKLVFPLSLFLFGTVQAQLRPELDRIPLRPESRSIQTIIYSAGRTPDGPSSVVLTRYKPQCDYRLIRIGMSPRTFDVYPMSGIFELVGSGSTHVNETFAPTENSSGAGKSSGSMKRPFEPRLVLRFPVPEVFPLGPWFTPGRDESAGYVDYKLKNGYLAGAPVLPLKSFRTTQIGGGTNNEGGGYVWIFNEAEDVLDSSKLENTIIEVIEVCLILETPRPVPVLPHAR